MIMVMRGLAMKLATGVQVCAAVTLTVGACLRLYNSCVMRQKMLLAAADLINMRVVQRTIVDHAGSACEETWQPLLCR